MARFKWSGQHRCVVIADRALRGVLRQAEEDRVAHRHGPQLTAAEKAAAAAKGCAYIDLTSLSTAWYNSLGSSAAALKFHALGTDVTHTNLAGADKLASLVAGAIKSQNIGLSQYLR